jgi:HPt (histidine-containing phosphotransfer) domain-containing protein
MAEPTIDLAAFRDLQETAGADFVKELVATFLEEAPGMLADLRSALAEGDADKFRRAAHSLKSNSLSFGATPLGTMARGMELAGVDRVAQLGAQPLEALVAEYARVGAALTELSNA